jgi:hypothetical protein
MKSEWDLSYNRISFKKELAVWSSFFHFVNQKQSHSNGIIFYNKVRLLDSLIIWLNYF